MPPQQSCTLVLLVSFSFLAVCSGDGVTPTARTDQVTRVRIMDRLDPADARRPYDVTERNQMLAEGYGDTRAAPGEDHVPVVLGGGTASAPGPNAALITRFVHLADIQLTDDESPGRLTLVDAAGPTSAAYRPQDAYGCHMLSAMTRTINEVHSETADEGGVSFVLLGGDNIDNAQGNELTWLLQLLGGGGAIECDSGADDDPVAGAAPHPDDPKDSFDSEGLDVPYYWVMGNHDVLVQGNFVPDVNRHAEVIGDSALLFARNWTEPGGPLRRDTVADATRAYLTPGALMDRVRGDGAVHGLDATIAASSRATYAFDVAGTNLRVVVVDSTARRGSNAGVVLQAELDGTIRPLMEQADTDGKWVIVTSHHAASSFNNGGGIGGIGEPTAITSQAWIDFLSSYDHVLLSLVAHSHQHRVRELRGAGGAFFEVMTAALLDFPHQSRLIEIYDEDNGFLRVRATGIDMTTAGDPVAAEAYRLGVMDYTAGWAKSSEDEATDRNVDLYLPRPM